jgi:hypothetical protein
VANLESSLLVALGFGLAEPTAPACGGMDPARGVERLATGHMLAGLVEPDQPVDPAHLQEGADHLDDAVDGPQRQLPAGRRALCLTEMADETALLGRRIHLAQRHAAEVGANPDAETALDEQIGAEAALTADGGLVLVEQRGHRAVIGGQGFSGQDHGQGVLECPLGRTLVDEGLIEAGSPVGIPDPDPIPNQQRAVGAGALDQSDAAGAVGAAQPGLPGLLGDGVGPTALRLHNNLPR